MIALIIVALFAYFFFRKTNNSNKKKEDAYFKHLDTINENRDKHLQKMANIEFECNVKMQANEWHCEWYRGHDMFLKNPKYVFYMVYHEPTAKYKNVSFHDEAYKQLEKLKEESGPRPETKMDKYIRENSPKEQKDASIN